ncbi:hypothetical protein [Streptomyces dysideae]|uniref:Uncharacterized protein n=1 Tax=Streptomyces dysideae TaxID=909626 RepID=A0A117RZ31_9ACTN|nr:hypothetical protein [Streptomyces dysideae]KUO17526.1 hypothetical protein AQJ91_29445 [Streptomyces dysideae]
MVRVSCDCNLKTVPARRTWHLRDELDITSQPDRPSAAGDISPRRETAEVLTDCEEYEELRKQQEPLLKEQADRQRHPQELSPAHP